MEYERIRASGKTLYLSDTSELWVLGQKCLSGTQVDKQGEYVYEAGGVAILIGL